MVLGGRIKIFSVNRCKFEEFSFRTSILWFCLFWKTENDEQNSDGTIFSYFRSFRAISSSKKKSASCFSSIENVLSFFFQAIDRFRAILDDIRTDTSPISDGGHVHPLTSHVIVFIETLLKYRPIVTRIIAIYSQQNGSQNIRSFLRDKMMFELVFVLFQLYPARLWLVNKKLFITWPFLSVKFIFACFFYHFLRWIFVFLLFLFNALLVQLINAWFENISRKTDKQTARQDTVLRTIFLLTNVNFLLKRLEEYAKIVSRWISRIKFVLF